MGLPRIVKKILPQNWVYAYEQREQHKKMHNTMSVEDWIKAGKPLPAPVVVKRSAMIEYAKRFNATHFIETGTFMGDTTMALKGYFDKLDTIELDEKLAKRAKEVFKSYNHITTWQGDSGVKLKEILDKLPKNIVCFFWLDGHFSGGITAKADLNTPISAELNTIFEHNKHHVIFIDDARLFFSGEADYPSYEELVKQITMYDNSVMIESIDDIIRITPSVK
ncbi:MAG: hypothetical protein HC817_06335 [Saprospiraceae bacterium]|nr:hypothetical protein [Saprospiraceae bacterium]